MEPCFVDEVSRSAVKYFSQSFGLFDGNKKAAEDVTGHITSVTEVSIRLRSMKSEVFVT